MATGWLQLDGAWYYFDPSSGVMATGSQRIGWRSYRFADSGQLMN